MPWKTFAGLSFTLIVLAFVGAFERQDVERQAERYCKMVDLYRQTDGDQGWPNYSKNYDEVCK